MAETSTVPQAVKTNHGLIAGIKIRQVGKKSKLEAELFYGDPDPSNRHVMPMPFGFTDPELADAFTKVVKLLDPTAHLVPLEDS